MTSLNNQPLSESVLSHGSGRWKPYPAYKDSEIAWLGVIPQHWEVRKLKHNAKITFSSVDKHSHDDEIPVYLCNYVDVYKNEYVTDQLDFMKATASADEMRRFLLQRGDLLVTKDSESWDDIAIPAYVQSDLPGVLCGYHLALVRYNRANIEGKYLFRAFQAETINYQFQIAANGITRYGLGKYAIDNGLFPVPPIDEQRNIASFLDRETEKIDALIAKKQRLVELLQEKRTALISQAVTKGLDPNVPMKDSGVEWLGEVPKHWERSRVKWITSNHKQGYYTEQSYVDVGVKLLRITDINDFGEVSFENAPKVDVNQTEEELFSVKNGDFLFARSGTIGRFGIVKNAERSVFASYLIRFRFKAIDIEYLRYAFLSHLFKENLISDLHGGANQNIHAENIKNQVIPLPPILEQVSITTFLDNKTAKVDQLIIKVRSAILKLQEYRTALIAAAVTGKIDVRDVISVDA